MQPGEAFILNVHVKLKKEPDWEDLPKERITLLPHPA